MLLKKTEDGKGIVGAVFLGLVSSKDKFLTSIKKLIVSDVLTLGETESKPASIKAQPVSAKLNECEFIKRVKDYLSSTGAVVLNFKSMSIEDGDQLYQAQIKADEKEKNLYIMRIY